MAASRVVLLPSERGDPAFWDAVERALPRKLRALTVPWPRPAAGAPPFTPERGAETVAAAMQDAGVRTATVCGVGVGALVALQLAASHPERVSGLVLATRQTALSPVIMSLPAAVLRLLPATAVARLGAGHEQLMALLDQARPVDFTAVARRVETPAVVLCGARDRLNRRASATLAKTLPQGRLAVIPRVGVEWLTERPDLLAEALAVY